MTSVLFQRLLLIGVFALLVTSAISAQSDDEIWFWAWRPYDLIVETPEDQRGDVLAFAPDGTSNVLLDDVFPIGLRRIDETHAFVGARHKDAYHLYYLTPTEAIEVMLLFDQAYVDDLGIYRPEGYSFYIPEIIPNGEDRYLILDPRRDQYGLFDVSERTLNRFDLRPWCSEGCLSVSEDGRFIRYRVPPANPLDTPLSAPNPYGLPYHIYEYDIVTQTERLLFEQKARPSENEFCTSDLHGERWFCKAFVQAEGGRPAEQFIITADGSIQPIDPDWYFLELDHQWYFLEVGEECTNCPTPEPVANDQSSTAYTATGTFDDECNPCTITVFPDGKMDQPLEFPMPHHNTFYINVDEIQLLSESHLLISTGINYFALSRAGELTLLGEGACCTHPQGYDRYDAESGWLVLINQIDPQHPVTEIWQTQPFTHFISLPWPEHAILYPSYSGKTFRDYSLVLFNNGSDTPVMAYSYLDETFYEFDFEGAYSYMDAFAGGVIVVQYEDGYTNNFAHTNERILRWTPDEGLTPILEQAVPIPD